MLYNSANIQAELPKPIVNLTEAFEKFKDLEYQSWVACSRTPPDKRQLVKPSGSLLSPLAHHLHQPSFNSIFLQDGETADKTSGCIAMVMGNAFQEGYTLIFDHIHRREPKSEGLEVYPEEVIRCHEDFTQQICESMVAKVEVVYGDKIKDRILTNRKSKYTILPLWGWLEGVCLPCIGSRVKLQ